MTAVESRSEGFALPTIMIAAVVMMIVMVAGVGAVSSILVAQDNARYQQLAQEAADSGMVMAKACLAKTSGVPQWNSSKPLKPGSDCGGVQPATCSSATPASTCFVLNAAPVRTDFVVTTTTNADGTVAQLTSTGTARLIRSSNGASWKTYTDTRRSTPGGSSVAAGPGVGGWTQRTYRFGYRNAVISNDGTKLLDVDSNGNLWHSMDSGTTWRPRPGLSGVSTEPGMISTNLDGTKLAAITYSSPNTYALYTSTDSGTTWVKRTIAQTVGLSSVTSSSDGQRLMALGDNSWLYISTDGGSTWPTRYFTGCYSSLSSNADGTKLACDSGGVSQISSNSGQTWTTLGGPINIAGIVISGDGTKLAEANSSNDVYTSSNSGATWTQVVSGGANTSSLSANPGGNRLLITHVDNTSFDEQSHFQTSANWGATWTRPIAFSNIGTTVASADGSTLLAAAYWRYGGGDTDGTHLWRSSDSGVSWSLVSGGGIPAGCSPSGYDQQVAIDRSGTRMAVACGGGLDDYVSVDSGATWTKMTGYHGGGAGLLMSSGDGKTLLSVQTSGSPLNLYLSSDLGATWSTRTVPLVSPSPSSLVYFASTTSNGSRIALSDNSGYVYVSSDAGVSWSTTNTNTITYTGPVMTADGSNLITASNGNMLRSVDGGRTWAQIPGTGGKQPIAISDDGTHIAATDGSTLYLSPDRGVTWAVQSASGVGNHPALNNIYRGAASSDGSRVIISAGGDLWTNYNSVPKVTNWINF